MIDALKARVAALHLPPAVRDALLADALLREHRFYLGLAAYIAPAFAPVPAARLEAIAVAGYLYFRFLLAVDGLMDGGAGADRRDLFGHLALYESAVRGLAELFPDGDPFWHAFEGCKREYAAAHVRERALSRARGPATRAVFEEVAAGKSAVCYAMVHALSRLSGSCAPVAPLLDCLRSVHVAFQYMDDVEDFGQDAARGDWTYAHARAAARLAERGTDGAALTPRQRHQRFYTTGVADELLAAAAGHLARGRDAAEGLGLREFAGYVASQLARVRGYREEVALLSAKAAVKASKSGARVGARPADAGGPPLGDAAERAVRRGIVHLRRSRDVDGAWSDFVTSAGHGRLWVTGYAGLQLAETGRASALVRRALDAVAASPEAYNATMQQDGDSTTFLLACRQRAGGGVDAEARRRWLAFMRPDGGWVTYREPAELRRRLEMDASADVGGWLGPKACVTAAAAYALSTFPDGAFPELADAYHRTCGHLLATRRADGSWPSYWWTSPVYATSFALLAFCRDARYAAAGVAAAAWLAGRQRADGSWEGSALYTALAARALAEHGRQPRGEVSHDDAVARGAAWLVAAQTADGSWPTDRVLRIPPAHVEDPDAVRRWRASSFGVCALVDDHNRVFTTSTAVAALHAYVRHAGATPAAAAERAA